MVGKGFNTYLLLEGTGTSTTPPCGRERASTSRRIVRRTWHQQYTSLVAGKGLQDTLLEGPGSSNTPPLWQGKGFNGTSNTHSLWQGKGVKTHCQKEQPPAIHIPCGGKGLQDTLLEGTATSNTHSSWRERASRHIVRRNNHQQDTFLVEGKGFRTHC